MKRGLSLFAALVLHTPASAKTADEPLAPGSIADRLQRAHLLLSDTIRGAYPRLNKDDGGFSGQLIEKKTKEVYWYNFSNFRNFSNFSNFRNFSNFSNFRNFTNFHNFSNFHNFTNFHNFSNFSNFHKFTPAPFHNMASLPFRAPFRNVSPFRNMAPFRNAAAIPFRNALPFRNAVSPHPLGVRPAPAPRLPSTLVRIPRTPLHYVQPKVRPAETAAPRFLAPHSSDQAAHPHPHALMGSAPAHQPTSEARSPIAHPHPHPRPAPNGGAGAAPTQVAGSHQHVPHPRPQPIVTAGGGGQASGHGGGHGGGGHGGGQGSHRTPHPAPIARGLGAILGSQLAGDGLARGHAADQPDEGSDQQAGALLGAFSDIVQNLGDLAEDQQNEAGDAPVEDHGGVAFDYGPPDAGAAPAPPPAVANPTPPGAQPQVAAPASEPTGGAPSASAPTAQEEKPAPTPSPQPAQTPRASEAPAEPAPTAKSEPQPPAEDAKSPEPAPTPDVPASPAPTADVPAAPDRTAAPNPYEARVEQALTLALGQSERETKAIDFQALEATADPIKLKEHIRTTIYAAMPGLTKEVLDRAYPTDPSQTPDRALRAQLRNVADLLTRYRDIFEDLPPEMQRTAQELQRRAKDEGP
jgi:hypothetical protein